MTQERTAVKRHIEIEQGSNFAFVRRLYHHTLDDDQVLFDTSDYTARFTVRATDWDGAIVVDATDADYITLGYTPAPWESATAYTTGQYVVPTTLNGFIYEVTDDGGTSGGGEPTWPTTISGTVADNNITWTCISTDSWLANFYLNLPSSYTEALTDWGAGVYSIDLTDEFGSTQRLYHGSARLSREASYT